MKCASNPFGKRIINRLYIYYIYIYICIVDEHGLRRPPWFCFVPSFWGAQRKSSALLYNQDPDETTIQDCMEPVTANLRDKNQLKIFNIKKTYKSKGNKTVRSVDGKASV